MNEDPDVSIGYGTLPARKRIRWWRIAIPLIVIGGFVFMCSGLQLPMLRKQHSLASRLQSDIGIGLPTGTVVLHGVSVMTRDPAEFFDLQVPPAAMPAFIAGIESAAASRGIRCVDADVSHPWTMETPPSWWRSAKPADEARLNFGSDGWGYWVYYSMSTGYVCVFWFRT